MPTSPVTDIEDSCDEIRREYRDMPGLCLTKSQVCRRWNLDSSTSDVVLSRLISTGFLRKTKVGYVLTRTATAGYRDSRSRMAHNG